jgi:hypothetical protein
MNFGSGLSRPCQLRQRCLTRYTESSEMTAEHTKNPQACALLAPGGSVPRDQRRWRDAAGEHIDVRGLAPPQPLLAILRLVQEQGTAGAAVVVHHDRDPAMLYPELAELGWSAERVEGEPGELRLRLTRVA